MRLLLLSLACALVCGYSSAKDKVSILGDSYSTFGGYVAPSTNLCWYNGPDGGDQKQNDVTDVSQTWWHLLVDETDLQLERNNSFSGATICTTGYYGDDYSDRAFITRAINLGDPDVIIVFGGTNDSWAHSPVGDFRYSGWTKSDLAAFRPAFAYLIHQLQSLYPGARIINVTNSELSPEVTQSMDTICRHYGVENVLLTDVNKQWGHPSIAGMRAIADQVKAVVVK